MKNWLNNLVRRPGLAVLNFRFNSQTKLEQKLRSFAETPVTTFLVWTREEAEVAWKAGRTEVNLATKLPENATSTKSATGRFMVDGRPALIELCLNEAVKRRLLTPPGIRLEAIPQMRPQGLKPHFCGLETARLEAARFQNGFMRWLVEPGREKGRDERKRARSSKPHTCITSSPQRVPKFPPDPEPIKGKTCRKCGGPLVLKILSYNCEPWTDTITPADTAEECLRCGRPDP